MLQDAHHVGTIDATETFSSVSVYLSVEDQSHMHLKLTTWTALF